MQRQAGPKSGRAGALTFVQRFGGSLNLHVHLHVLFLEGLFTRAEDSAPIFHPALSPTRADLLEVLARVQRSVGRWLKKQRLEPDTDANESDTALDGCARVAVQRGLFDALPGAKQLDDGEPAGLGRHSVSLDGFNLHAAVAVSADDDVSRERLVRYCARPPFALERLSVLPDGRIAYRIIAALVPPPRHPFLRYHGVLAPASKWRSAIVPRPKAHEEYPHASNRAPGPTPDANLRDTTSRIAIHCGEAARPPYSTITHAHRRRLANGALFAESPRLEWSKLLRRTFATEVLLCPRCHGQSRIIAAVQDPIG